MKSVFAVVVGQGLAGTAMAWEMLRRGLAVHVVDEGEEIEISGEASLKPRLPNVETETSSRVAAGLITPITGQRLVKTWRWDEAIKTARSHYEIFEKDTGTRVFNSGVTLRLFDSEAEKQKIESRLEEASEPLIEAYASQSACEDAVRYFNEWGGFLMASARLETERYLSISRQWLRDKSAFSLMLIVTDHDIERRSNRFVFPRLDIEAEHVVFAQGSRVANDGWFPQLPLAPVHGDILTLEIEDLIEPRTIHRGVWLTRIGGETSNRYLVGSTHRRESTDGRPSKEGHDEILSKLKSWLKVPFRVVDHRAALRPGSFDQKPLIGESRVAPGAWILNGLGSKGALYAPLMAGLLVDNMERKSQIPSELQWDRRQKGSRLS